jgi:hypothetical protein
VPRISADAMSVVAVAEIQFPPPAHLGDEEATVFRDVVGTADRGHFRHEDRELLALYAAHVVTARKLMARKRRTAEQQRDLRAETALVMSLSTKLRLGPKSRAPDNRRAASAGLRASAANSLGYAPSQPVEPATEAPLATRWTTTKPAA